MLHLPLGGQIRFVEHQPQGLRLFDSDAMLAGDGAAYPDAFGQDFVAGLLHGLDLPGIALVKEEIRVDIAVARVEVAGHTEVVRCIRAQLSVVPNLHLVGNYLEGVSINDCVRQARATVDKMVALPSEAAALSSG